jgi:hypothetical protein
MTDKLEEHDDIIEVFIDYKKGLRTRKTAVAEMIRLGFEEGVAQAMLSAMRKHGVADIRNGSNRPQHLTDGLEKYHKACRENASKVSTDNK